VPTPPSATGIFTNTLTRQDQVDVVRMIASGMCIGIARIWLIEWLRERPSARGGIRAAGTAMFDLFLADCGKHFGGVTLGRDFRPDLPDLPVGSD